MNQFPKTIFLNIDESCNLSCPSCRPEVIKNSSVHSQELIEQIDAAFAKDVVRFHCTGAGDPFYSRICREWMMNLDIRRYKKLSHFFIHTNAILWTQDLWRKMPALHNLRVDAEISIDAASKKTYEIVRRGGRWESLQNNLLWLSKDPQLKDHINFSFVVQKTNHHEMVQFVHMVRNLFPNARIEFRQLQQWGRSIYNENRLYADHAVHDKSHSHFNEFYQSMQYIQNTFTNIAHNFHDILNEISPA